MGANCCVAAKSASAVAETSIEVSTFRNDIYSPSWSFQWDNGTHVDDSIDSHSRVSHGNNANVGSDVKSYVDTELEGISDGECPFSSFKRTSLEREARSMTKDQEREISFGSPSSIKAKQIRKFSAKHGRLTAKDSNFSPSSTVPKTDPSCSRSSSLPSGSTSLRKTFGSPSYQISRQTSDSNISLLESQNQSSPAEEKQTFHLSNHANYLSPGGLNGISSENWSVRLFSELVAYSQRDRRPLDGDSFCIGYGKLQGSSHQPNPSASTQKCAVCSKLLKERSPWSGRKIVTNEVPVIAVLVCGHVYHADCLEKVTSELERFDPSCPVCSNGGKSISKLWSKVELKSKGKISRIAVASIDLDKESANDRKKGVVDDQKGPNASSSVKGSLAKPFLKRHFSFGSRIEQSSSEIECSKKKGFWSRHGRSMKDGLNP